jgi:hypothetical protein
MARSGDARARGPGKSASIFIRDTWRRRQQRAVIYHGDRKTARQRSQWAHGVQRARGQFKPLSGTLQQCLCGLT